jgi:hypothetical protein
LGALSNSDAHQDNGPDPYVRSIFNDDWCKLDGIMENGFAFPLFRVGGSDDFDTRSDAHVLSNHQAACPMEKTLLSDPSAPSDDDSIPVIALQDGVMTDVDIVFQYNILWMEDQHPRLNDHSAAEVRELAGLK